jgi:hypothetical protein
MSQTYRWRLAELRIKLPCLSQSILKDDRVPMHEKAHALSIDSIQTPLIRSMILNYKIKNCILFEFVQNQKKNTIC